MQKLQHQTLSFGDYTLDLARGCLLRDEEQVKLRPKSFGVLSHLAENCGRLVSKAELMQAVWPDSFVTDDSLVQCLIEIRRALGDDSHRYIKTVPRRGYLFEAQVVNYVQPGRETTYTEELERVDVLIEEEVVEGETNLAPALEKPQPTSTQRRLSGINSNKRALVAFVLAVLTLGGLGAYLLANRGESIDSVAVMPFVNVGGDPEMEYLADGITESVISNLSQLSQLKVISRNSVIRYKGKEIDPRAVGRELGVRAVLVGRIEARVDKLAFSLELIDTKDNRQLWGEQYSRQLSDALQVQADISRAVSEKLRQRLTGEEQKLLTKRYTENGNAYKLYLKGRYHWDKLTVMELEKSIEYFRQAIDLDPRYALAYAGLADSSTRLAILGRRPPTEIMPKAKAAIVRALEIDQNLAEAHATLAFIRYLYEWDWAGVEQQFKRAIELNPNSSVSHHQYAYFLSDAGRFDESVSEIRRAIELDPLSAFITKDGGQILYLARRYDQAIDYLQQARDLDPHFGPAYSWLERCYEAKGLYDQAIEMEFKRMTVTETSPEEISAYRAAYVAKGWKGFWRKRLDSMKQAKGRVDPYFFAIVYARLEEKHEALAWLEKAYDERSLWLAALNNEPLFDRLRSERRFQELQRRVGFPPPPRS